MVTKLEHILPLVMSKGKKKRLVVAYANDLHTIEAVYKAVSIGIVEATLLGDFETIKNICIENNIDYWAFSHIQQENDAKCVSMAIDMINMGKADILMKGLVTSDKYLRGILKKDGGLMGERGILSHVTVLEVASLNKLLVVSDVAVLPSPDINQKVAITNYVIETAHALGMETPKVAMIAPSEQVLPKLDSSADAAIIAKMCDRGQIKGAVIDGPLALDVAIDAESAKIKKVTSSVAGDADCLVFPNIESANVFFKTCTKLLRTPLAAIVVGTKAPCVLTSRGDTMQSKLYSIALAALAAK
ncbi:MAG: phosphate acyltransferase [Rikenellaceae bacterium]